MRILFDATTQGSGDSGTRTRTLGLAEALARRGIEVGIVHGSSFLEGGAGRPDGAATFDIGRVPGSPWVRSMVSARAWREPLRRFGPDLVVADALPMPHHRHLVAQVHDLRHAERRLWRFAAARSLGRAVRIHVPTRYVAAELARVFPRFEGRTRCVPNGVDPRRFHPGPVPADAAVLASRQLTAPFLLSVGHLEDRKAPALLLHLARDHAERGLQLPVIFVGRGPALPEEGLTVLRAAWPNRDHGRVFRDVTAAELPAFYRAATALVAPAWLEGFGLAPLEALACGTPVVASDIPAHREVLGSAALFAPPGHVAAFAARIQDLRFGMADRATLIHRGVERAHALTWDAAASAFLDALE